MGTPHGLWGECSLQLHRIKINIDHAYKLPVTVSNRDSMIDHSTVDAQSHTLSCTHTDRHPRNLIQHLRILHRGSSLDWEHEARGVGQQRPSTAAAAVLAVTGVTTTTRRVGL